MQEMIQNAAMGWVQSMQAGKYGVLLLGLLLWTWYLGGEERKRSLFWRYTVCVTVGAICPLTAALWMEYQTAFFDYEWIWSAVPVTGFVAAAAAGGFAHWFEEKKAVCLWKKAGALVCAALILWLCGNMGIEKVQGLWTPYGESASNDRSYLVVEVLEDVLEEKQSVMAAQEDLCVWAPAEVLERVRERNGRIRLLYGRNMWEASLNAYSYEVYDPEVIALFDFMEAYTAATDEGVLPWEPEPEEGRKVLEEAIAQGVNCMVLPENRLLEEELAKVALSRGLHVRTEGAAGYVICLLENGSAAETVSGGPD